MIGCGLAGNFQQLLMWRFVTGMGSALQMAGAQLFLADISKASNRARVLGTNQVPPPPLLPWAGCTAYLVALLLPRRRASDNPLNLEVQLQSFQFGFASYALSD